MSESNELNMSAGSASRGYATAVGAFAALGWAMPELKWRRSSADIRHDPNREKTAEDLERIEAARLKRERKAAKKLSLQNVKCDNGEAQPRS